MKKKNQLVKKEDKEKELTEGFEFEFNRNLSFAEYNKRLKKMIRLHGAVRYGVQALFSWVVINNLWQEPLRWVDRTSGAVYESEDEIPRGRGKQARRTISVQPVYEFQEDWIRELEQESPIFSRSTAFYRHHRILYHMKALGRSFEEALRAVMLSPGLIKVVLNAVLEDGQFNKEAVNQLTANIKEAREKETPEDKVRTYLEVKEDEMERGEIVPRQATQDVRSKVFGKQTIVAYLADETEHADLAFYHEDGKGNINTYYFAAVDENGSRIRIPAPLLDWLDRKLSFAEGE